MKLKYSVLALRTLAKSALERIEKERRKKRNAKATETLSIRYFRVWRYLFARPQREPTEDEVKALAEEIDCNDYEDQRRKLAAFVKATAGYEEIEGGNEIMIPVRLNDLTTFGL